MLAIGVSCAGFLQATASRSASAARILVNERVWNEACRVYAVGDFVLTLDRQTKKGGRSAAQGPTNRQAYRRRCSRRGRRRIYDGFVGTAILKDVRPRGGTVSKNERTMSARGYLWRGLPRREASSARACRLLSRHRH